MKLVIATPLYPPEPGGPATYAKLLEEELPKSGIELSLVKFSDVRRLPKIFRHFAYYERVKKAAKNADLIVALDPVSTGLPAMRAAQKLGKPFVIKIVGDYAWEQGTQRFGITENLDEFQKREDVPAPVRVLQGIQRKVTNNADRIIVPSEYLKGIVMQWGIAPEKISVIYNAEPDVQGVTKPTASPYIVSISRLVPWKGVAAVIKAFARLRANGSSLKLVIVGDGPEKSALIEKASSLGVSKEVIFTGALPHAETLAQLAAAKALVLNTKYEGFSHLLLEACALGVPVLTTPVGGNPEIITDNETGFLFTPDDVEGMAQAIERIEKDSALREKLIAGAKAKVASFSRERLVSETIQLFKSLI